MISFHAALSPDRRPKMTIPDSLRKRKWGDVVGGEGGEVMNGSGKPGSFSLDVGLRLEEPLRQGRIVDTQPGEVHFYEARTNESTCKDREITTVLSDPPTTVRRAVSLNLELNLQPYDEYLSPQEAERTASSTRRHSVVEEDPWRSSKKAEQSVDAKEEEEEEEGGETTEMVATVCGRCHMLVMLCVSRPCCPNCKFLHPKPDQTTPFTLLSFRPHHPKSTTTAQLLC